jgi:hypothetical protein
MPFIPRFKSLGFSGIFYKIPKDEHLMKTIERLKEDLIKKGKKKYFITIA